MIPGARCASLDALDSMVIRSSIVLVANIRGPEGWKIVIVGSCVADLLDGAPLDNNDTIDDESTSAAVFISGGLAHPGWRYMLFANLRDNIEYMFMLPSASSPRQFAMGF